MESRRTNQGETRSLADYQLTLDAAEIQALLTKSQGLVPGLEQVLNRVIAAEVAAFVQAGRYERTATRQDHHNGTRPRFLATRVGRVRLQVPRVRGAASSRRCWPATRGVSRPGWPR